LTAAKLTRQLGLFDATMIVMGGIVGSGIFINPYVVARQVHTPFLIVGVWFLGGILALLGAFIYAELASVLPGTGGQYVYLREAFGAPTAFIYGWGLLLVTGTGGVAAVAITFARYLKALTGVLWPEQLIAVVTLAILCIVNCLGVRSGSNVQSALMVLKTMAITALVVFGFSTHSHLTPALPMLDQTLSLTLLAAIGAAMTPVAFAYGGWQTASFVAGEMKNPARDLSRGLLLGVSGVIVLYVSVNYICVRALGADGLAATTVPATAVMTAVLGERGARWIAMGIAVSTVGFLSQSILTIPRVYYAMAEDGVFFHAVAWLHPRTQVPVVAIALEGIVAALIAVSGKYEQILNYVVSVDFVSFGMTGAALLILRKRLPRGPFRAPGHPFTTWLFIVACLAIVASTVLRYPANSAIGYALLLAGVPVYFFWRKRKSA
jgi:APA family basic amino acid/polyamine antiporter